MDHVRKNHAPVLIANENFGHISIASEDYKRIMMIVRISGVHAYMVCNLRNCGILQ
jgi:hypothetical protein